MTALLLLLAVITLATLGLCWRLAKENDQLRGENTRLGGVTQYQQEQLDEMEELARKAERGLAIQENAIAEFLPAGAKLKLGPKDGLRMGEGVSRHVMGPPTRDITFDELLRFFDKEADE